MQVLKEDVLNKIKQAAVECFMEYGYDATSMREIGKRADISVGNVYRYVDNKEALFDLLVDPAIQLLKESQKQNMPPQFPFLDVNLLNENRILDQLVELHMNYRDAMFLLMLRNTGTKYEQIKIKMREIMVFEIRKYLTQLLGEDQTMIQGDIYPKVAATAIIEGICVILEESEDDRTFIFNMIQFLELNIKSVVRYLTSMKENEANFRRISDEEINIYFSNTRSCRDIGDDHRS